MTGREIHVIPFAGKALEYESNASALMHYPAPERGFLVGPENRLLEPIVRWAVEGDPMREQLPILFYGVSGSGKTHLLHGIVEAWRKDRKPTSKRRSYLLTAADFARQFSEAMSMRTTDDFRRRYRQAELLALDDLDHLHDKAWAQEELRHVLDILAAAGATVVLTATGYPGSAFLPPLAERLQGGTVLPILLPGPEVRERFLKELSSAFRLDFPTSALEHAARELPVSIPQLYGTFSRMRFEASVQGVKADAVYLAAFLRARAGAGKTGMDELAKRTARHFSLKVSDLRGKSRSKAVATARSVAIYLIRRQTRQSVQEIARYFGNRDPSTIRYLIDRVRDELLDDAALRDHLYRLEEG